MTNSKSRIIQSISVVLFAGLVVYLHLANPLQDAVIEASGLRVKVGDGKNWAWPDMDDSEWQNEVPSADTLFWLRTTVVLPAAAQRFEPLGVSMSISASYEIYWDGHLIGQNGRVGNSAAEEIHGSYSRAFIIPDTLATAGPHQIAMRLSSFDGVNTLSMGWPTVGNFLILTRRPVVLAAFMHLLAGAFLMIAIYYLFIYFINDRRQAFLLFALLCLVFFALMLIEFSRFYIDYPYPFQFIRLGIIILLTATASLLLPVFLMYRFSVLQKLRSTLALLAAFILFALLFDNADHSAMAVVFLSFATALGVSLRALRQRQPGSSEAFLGVVACLIGLGYFGVTIFLGFAFLVVFTLLSLSIQIRKDSQAHEEALLRSARLEVQLLKSRIRPHFLLNTLTSLITWVEESPKVAVAFIETLAREFEILNEISDQQEIPVEQEIALCRAHLDVMSLRQEVRYHLECDGIAAGDQVPPAIFHTLIENGLTHNQINCDEMVFRLSFTQQNGRKTYRLLAAGLVRNGTDHAREGTGMKYVKARLQECYPDRWQMQPRPTPAGWETQITIEGT